MKILLISDAWKPQVNGVVNSLNMTCIKLREIGHKIEVIGPDKFKTFPCPSYPSIRLSLFLSNNKFVLFGIIFFIFAICLRVLTTFFPETLIMAIADFPCGVERA